MSFSKLIRDLYRESTLPKEGSSFAAVNREELETHLAISKYGQFELTDAIRPSYDLQVIPEEAFRHDVWRDRRLGISIPVLMGSISKEKLLDVFFDILDPLGPVVDVILESSHSRRKRGHADHLREEIDLPILKSVLYDYEDLILNDGCLGMAVLNSAIPLEVQFDEHKILTIYGDDIKECEKIFLRHGIKKKEKVRFLTEAEHVHSSKASYLKNFGDLRMALGMDYDEIF